MTTSQVQYGDVSFECVIKARPAWTNVTLDKMNSSQLKLRNVFWIPMNDTTLFPKIIDIRAEIYVSIVMHWKI